jgi:superfamily II DNA or RNA helicase
VIKNIPNTQGYYTSNQELIIQGTPESLALIKNYLTIKNKAIDKRLKELKRTSAFNAKHAHVLKQQIKELEEQLVTKAYAEVDDGISTLPGFWFLCNKVEGHTASTKAITFGDERYYQLESVQTALQYKRSCIVAATGVGKSRIIRNLAASHVAQGRRVIVIVPSIELLHQTYKTVVSGMDKIGCKKVGKLGGGTTPPDGVMCLVSTAQSCLNYIDRFQTIIVDETHTMAAPSYQDIAIAGINAEFFHGLTATIERPDGMTPLIYGWAGAPVYVYRYSDGVQDGFLSPVKYIPKVVSTCSVKTSKNMHSTKEYIKLHSDPEYIKFVKETTEKALAANRKVLVLFKSVECANALASALETDAANGEYRLPIKKFKDGDTNVLIGNWHLLGTGIDLPEISAILLCMASTSEIMLMQAIGRGTRICEGKKDCVVIDISPNHAKYINQLARRDEIVRSFGIDSVGL